MTYRLLYTLIPALLFVGGAIAFATNTATPKVSLVDSLTDTLFIGSSSLSATTLSFSSNVDLSQALLLSSCDISSKLFSRELNIYTFVLRYNSPDCSSDFISLQDSDWNVIPNSQNKINVYSDFDLYDRFVDYSSPDLTKIWHSLQTKMSKTKIFANQSQWTGQSKFDFYAKKIRHYQYQYNADIIANILAYREHKYVVPVYGKEIAQKESKLPNALRLYRAEYTDVIHHGWDVDAELWSQTIAVDNGVIIRVVYWFTRADFARLKISDGLTTVDKKNNLDVLRWNQVWLKTMKWDVVFYSHLDAISVSEGDVVWVGDPIGTVGVTGIPGTDYTDYHLHFPIHKNPFSSSRAGSYTHEEIMQWPWYFKWKSPSYIREHQGDVFK